ncbi:hypothetical protein DCCM_4704 [Desulfocucumis palustris]|uniref:Uncharacterized protein n=1 Tax=Desulfocucumis palustris TaxID=1898651 RepID=A0A2L2XH85_9FIRM|nr:hypothetical protein DCCM_4704 [Desulfocucumis palustris]
MILFSKVSILFTPLNQKGQPYNQYCRASKIRTAAAGFSGGTGAE